MEDLKAQVVEKIEPIITSPAVQKALAATPLASGGAAFFDYTQGALAIVSVIVGILAGLLVIRYNHLGNKIRAAELERIQMENEHRKRELGE